MSKALARCKVHQDLALAACDTQGFSSLSYLQGPVRSFGNAVSTKVWMSIVFSLLQALVLAKLTVRVMGGGCEDLLASLADARPNRT